jgi:hemerythrin
MPLMTWNTSYSVGVAQFDHEHQRLFALINELGDAIQGSDQKYGPFLAAKGVASLAGASA